jgi:hypothetical protein
MFPSNLYFVHDLSQEYQRRRLREAETARLLQRITSARVSRWANGLLQLGEWLTVCGTWLKRRYDPLSPMRINSN